MCEHEQSWKAVLLQIEDDKDIPRRVPLLDYPNKCPECQNIECFEKNAVQALDKMYKNLGVNAENVGLPTCEGKYEDKPKCGKCDRKQICIDITAHEEHEEEKDQNQFREIGSFVGTFLVNERYRNSAQSRLLKRLQTLRAMEWAAIGKALG